MSTNITAVDARSIQHCLLINLELNSTTTYYLSNHFQEISYGGNTYNQLGYFLQMSEIQDDIKPTNNQIQVALAGVPNDIVPDFLSIALNTRLKGSRIKIYRAFCQNNQIISGQVFLRFSGYVSNYTLNETWDDRERLTSQTVSLQCSNLLGIIERQFTGRRTNEKDQKLWYPTDTAMDRVKILSDSSFQFGQTT